MTFVEKSGIGYKSPSLTPDRQNHFQSERNEDSAPQHLNGALVADDGAGPAIGDPIGSVRVPLPGGMFALIDAADAERANAFKWQAKRKKSKPAELYVQRAIRLTPGRGGKMASESLHRFVMGCVWGDGKIVDHKNGNGLDNCRNNLRVTNKRGNATNITSSKNQKAGGFKGVSFHKKARKWEAHIGGGEIKADGRRRRIYLGLHATAEQAARVYDAAALKCFGEFAALNFPLADEVSRAS
jgi:hypothetical protein